MQHSQLSLTEYFEMQPWKEFSQILIDMCCMPTDLQMIEVCTLKCQLEPQSSRMHFCGDYIKQIHSIERCKTCVMEAAGGRNTLSKTTLSKNEFREFF